MKTSPRFLLTITAGALLAAPLAFADATTATPTAKPAATSTTSPATATGGAATAAPATEKKDVAKTENGKHRGHGSHVKASAAKDGAKAEPTKTESRADAHAEVAAAAKTDAKATTPAKK